MHPMTGSVKLPRMPVIAEVMPEARVKPDWRVEPPQPPDLEHQIVDPFTVPAPDLDDFAPGPAAGDTGAIGSSDEGRAFTNEPSIIPVRTHPDHPLTQPVYPPASIRFGEEGVVELEILVLRDGCIAQVRVVRSSGHPRLDRAAVEEARERWRLQPALRGGVPRDERGHFRVVFRIANR